MGKSTTINKFMKKIFFICSICFLFSIVKSQIYYINNRYIELSKDTIKAASVKLTDGLYYQPSHSKLSFKDSAIVISGGSNIQITNATDSLYRVLETTQITYIKGDTCKILKKGGYFISPCIYGFATNNEDWRMQVAWKSGVTTHYSENVVDFTSTGGTNKCGGGNTFYIEFLANDKVWIVLTRTSGGGNFTVISSQFNISSYYLKN